jgi:ABC-type nitrate/sulfonate/bicarbonate transport system, permease component
MKRFLLAALFFAVLLMIWEALFRAKIWSPVLLPSPRQVAVYLEGAAVDGTLVKATIVTMRRLLIGYIIGLVVGLPLGLLTARWKVWQDTIGTLALGLQTLPSVCWVPLGVVVVRTDGSRYAFRRGNGHALVRRHRNGNWRAQRAANL